MGRNLFKTFLLLSVFCVSGCLSLPRSFHAMSYKNQTVTLDRNHYFKVGPLSEEWKVSTGQYPGIVFKNSVNEATITTEAVCGGGFEDLSLGLLTQNVLAGLGEPQKLKSEIWQIGDREALHTLTHATVDGVEVALDIVILKKDQCEFDFYAITVPKYAASVFDAFEGFVKGFQY